MYNCNWNFKHIGLNMRSYIPKWSNIFRVVYISTETTQQAFQRCAFSEWHIEFQIVNNFSPQGINKRIVLNYITSIDPWIQTIYYIVYKTMTVTGDLQSS